MLYGEFARGRRMRGLPEEAANSAAIIQLMRQGWGQENPAFRQMFTSLFAPAERPEQMQWWNDLPAHHHLAGERHPVSRS